MEHNSFSFSCIYDRLHCTYDIGERGMVKFSEGERGCLGFQSEVGWLGLKGKHVKETFMTHGDTHEHENG